MRHILLATVAIVGIMGAAQTASANLLTNGSLTGRIAVNSVPFGWTITLNSPDTNDVSNNVGGTTPFVTTPSGPSLDGGTWVGLGSDTFGFNEGFAQTVAGLTVGGSYDLSWYGGNFGANLGCPAYCNANAFEVFVNGTSVGNGGVINPGADWVTQSISFVAAAANATIEFRLRDREFAYLAIDGISLLASGDTPVPEPLSLGLFGLSLVGLSLARRRLA